MPTLTDGVEAKTCGITARVTQTFYEAFAAKAAEVSGRSPSEYARELLEQAVYGEPAHVKLMQELWALRYIVLNGLPSVAADPAEARTAIQVFKEQADQKKADRARTILQGTR